MITFTALDRLTSTCLSFLIYKVGINNSTLLQSAVVRVKELLAMFATRTVKVLIVLSYNRK